MEKKTYKTPCMKVRRIACTHMLCGSGGNETLNMFGEDDVKNLGEDYSQW